MNWVKATIAWLVASVIIYVVIFIDYLVNRWYIEGQISHGLGLRIQDQILYGFGTFQWWAFIYAAVVGFFAAIVILTRPHR